MFQPIISKGQGKYFIESFCTGDKVTKPISEISKIISAGKKLFDAGKIFKYKV